MDPPPRPKLSLKLSVGGGGGAGAANSNSNSNSNSNAATALSSTTHSAPPSQPQTPAPRAPQRSSSVTSLKFTIKSSANPSAISATSQPATPASEKPTPTGSTKKRKREAGADDGSGAPSAPQKAKAPKLLKLITKNGPKALSQPSAITPGIKLKTKGKIPKRPSGVGYDSELDDREVDPVILEAFVLRMPPGDDCNYIRESIASGTVGVSVLQKGADIRLRFLDVSGRRGILTVRGKQYAFSVVDLPTVTEGMKSWDRKNFIKSIDVSQMCLVLGRCTSDEEARNYPLPPDVNPKNFQYAHGLTAPMHNVRKRRFERTARARLDDIEAVERKVNSLLEADSKASKVTYDVLSYDPRRESEEGDLGSEDDAEAEEDEDYFGADAGAEPESSVFDDGQSHVAEHADVDIEDLEAMFEDDAHDPGTAAPSAAGQSFAADSDSVAPSPAAFDASADTPVAGTDDANADFDDDADNDNDNDDEDDDDEEQQEANTEKAALMAKIKEVEQRKAQLLAQLAKATSPPLKRKIAKKIQEIESDLGMLRRHAGIKVSAPEEGDEGEEGLGVTAGAESEEE